MRLLAGRQDFDVSSSNIDYEHVHTILAY